MEQQLANHLRVTSQRWENEKKTKTDSVSKSIACIAWKQVFTEMDDKIMCCDR